MAKHVTWSNMEQGGRGKGGKGAGERGHTSNEPCRESQYGLFPYPFFPFVIGLPSPVETRRAKRDEQGGANDQQVGGTREQGAQRVRVVK